MKKINKKREKYPSMAGLERSNDRNKRRVQANFLLGLSQRCLYIVSIAFFPLATWQSHFTCSYNSEMKLGLKQENRRTLIAKSEGETGVG